MRSFFLKKVFKPFLPYLSCTFIFILINACNSGPDSKIPVEQGAGLIETIDPAPPGDYTNNLNMSFNLIPSGTFMMGSPQDAPDKQDDEVWHQVTLTGSFYVQTTEVTQAQWEAVMDENPSKYLNCINCPVESVSWYDIQDFIDTLNTMGEGRYRLPTDAEWEYACRAGSDSALANGEITAVTCEYDTNLDEMGWYCYNSEYKTNPVAQKEPNAWGLYDMHGNVSEWCQDWYEEYLSGPIDDPAGPVDGSRRVFRDCGYGSYAEHCRSARRSNISPEYMLGFIGFRLVREP